MLKIEPSLAKIGVAANVGSPNLIAVLNFLIMVHLDWLDLEVNMEAVEGLLRRSADSGTLRRP